MKLRPFPAALASFALFSTLIAPAQQPAQVAQFTDPANLRGERVKPRDGRELPIDQGARGLEQMLRRLNTRASLMLIVAHPDDEDGGMLTYYSRGLGARVAVLTLTRGEGGQNAMTGDFEDALGLLRTQELLSADRYLGVDQFFGTEVDFGFSKTKEEAFKKWTHERVLYDAVRSIRLYRPLVIAAVFIGGVTDGHGQHQVSGQIAQEAFKAAADPTVFPDMIAEGILPWQALKVYARVPMQSISDKGLFDYATGKYTAPCFENYVTGEITTTVPSSDVIVHEGTTDPILSDNPSDPPRTYVQFARIGLGMQKSQIGNGVRVPPTGALDVAYHLYGSALCSSPTHINPCHPERSAQRGVEGSAVSPAAASRPEPPNSKPESAGFFDGIDISIDGIADVAPSAQGNIAINLKSSLRLIANSISEARRNFNPGHAQLAASDLAEALRLTNIAIWGLWSSGPESLPVEQRQVLHELRIKRAQIDEALVLALGLSFDASAPSANDGDVLEALPFNVETVIKSPSDSKLKVAYERLEDAHQDHYGGPAPWPLESVQETPDKDGLLRHTIAYGRHIYPPMSRPTRPYFSRPTIEQPFYDLTTPALRNAPDSPPALTAWASVEYNDVALDIARIVHDGNQSIRFVPPVNIAFSTHSQVLPSNDKTFTLLAFDHSQPANNRNYHLGALELPGDFSQTRRNDAISGSTTFTVAAPDPSSRTAFTVEATAIASSSTSAGGRHDGLTTSVASVGNPEGYRPIGYGDLPRTNYYTPATVRIVPVDLNLPATHRIAYLPGTGDAVPEALASINLKPDTLTVADLTPAKLSHYDTVILGVRTYNAHPDLHGAPTQALLDYARNGGNVLVQYQTAEFTAADAPYPLTLGYAAEKVVDETDPVQLLQPDAPLLTTPNKITPADFNDWVEERGHGFLSSWDSHYTSLTETHDPDQDPQRGGLITTPLGKGRWTYCAFALYRQLPEAVPGAFRLFVNLLNNPLSP